MLIHQTEERTDSLLVHGVNPLFSVCLNIHKAAKLEPLEMMGDS